MKKIGLAVVCYKDNFGSALQTYATQKVLNDLGYETGIFDIRGVHKDINRKKIGYYISRLFQPDEIKYLFDNLVSRTRKKTNASNDAYAQHMQIRHAMYQKFNEKWLEMLPRPSGWQELSQQSALCDHVVVGSDQLWRPSNIAGCFFTLEFVPDSVDKIALSTSFGVSKLPEQLHRHTRKYLSRLNSISVREESGREIVKDMIGRDIPVVCDPTMLLDAQQWMHIQQEKPIFTEPYILCYFMGNHPEHRDFVRRLREKTGYRIVGLMHGATYVAADEGFADAEPYDVGPAEFINLIRHAAYMCTDSFHGTVFSILNSTPFFSFRRYADESQFSTNDRLHTLLHWTDLSDRMLYGNEDAERCMAQQIDFTKVLEKVAEKRALSMAYLREALAKGEVK